MKFVAFVRLSGVTPTSDKSMSARACPALIKRRTAIRMQLDFTHRFMIVGRDRAMMCGSLSQGSELRESLAATPPIEAPKRGQSHCKEHKRGRLRDRRRCCDLANIVGDVVEVRAILAPRQSH